jgi:hypothetical protein
MNSTSSNAPYYNLIVDRGYDFTFNIDATDILGTSFSPVGCTATFTAVDPHNKAKFISFTSASGNITIGLNRVITVTLPGSVTGSLDNLQLVYDVVLVNSVAAPITKTLARGLLTIDQVV